MLHLINKITLYAILSLFLHINAMNIDDLQQKYLDVILECANEFPLTPQDVEQLKTKQLPDNQVVKCLFACAYKKTGMMDGQGMLSVNGVNKLAQKYFADDQDKLKKAQEFTDACASVNDEVVSDAQKGCERAALIFKCTVEKAPQGLTDEEVKKNFIKEIMICTKDFPAELTDLLELEQFKPPTKKNIKCLLACAYKRMRTINEKGLYDKEEAYKFAESVKDGDEKRFENGKKLADICHKVNDEKVSDGDQGCDRAVLVFKCVVEHAPKLGFKL